MVKFIIVRHGYSLYNSEKRFTGQQDIPLTERGFREAALAGAYICGNYAIDAVYSSDLSRAVHTAEPVADYFGLPIHKRKELREIHLGIWENMYFEEVRSRYADEYNTYRQDPVNGRGGITGETFSEMEKRALSAIDEIAKANEGKTVLVATHGGVIRGLLSSWLKVSGGDIYQVDLAPNASITEVIWENGEVTVLKKGETEHLKDF